MENETVFGLLGMKMEIKNYRPLTQVENSTVNTKAGMQEE